MSDIDALQDAFMKADTLAQQGDQQAAQDAKMFADEIRRLKSEGVSSGPEVMPNVNRGIADSVGGLVDFVNPFDKPHALNPFQEGTGSAQTGLTSLMESGGINVAQGEPEGFIEGAARGTGQAAGALVPAAGMAGLLRGAGGITGNIADDAFTAMTTWRGAAAEATAGALAGGSQESAQEAGLPDWAQQAAGIAGGVAGAGLPYLAARTPTAIGSRQVVKSAKKAIAPYTESGAGEVARERLQTLAGGQDRAKELAGRIDLNEEFGLTPAQQTNDPNMLAIEQAGGRVDPDLWSRLRDRQIETSGRIRGALDEMGGDTRDAQEFIGNLRRDVKNRMDSFVQWEKAGAAARQSRTQRTESENSEIVADRLRGAYQDARAEESQLWDAIPQEFEIDPQNALAAARQFIDKTPWPQREDIPPLLSEFSSMNRPQTIEEINSLYSKMRQVARAAMANDQNANKARMANNVADAILRDLEAIDAATDVGRKISRAREYSREMHATFDRGEVGKLLRRTSQGDTKINPQETLARSIGQSGVKSKVASEQIDTATRNDPTARASQADYLADQFNAKAFKPDGAFSRDQALRFMRDKRATLDRFPQLRERLSESIRAQEKAQRVDERIAQRKARLEDPRESVGAGFLDAAPGKAVDSILQARTPARAARELVRQASKDETGKALAGVKSAFSDRLIADSLRQIGGNKVVVGQSLADRLDSPEMASAMRQVFSNEEMRRLRAIRDAALSLDQGRKAAPDVGGVSTATPNRMIEFAVRIAAANHGAQMGQGAAGLQTAQMASGAAKKMLSRLMNDKAEQMLLDAIEDPKLFRALLLEPGKIDLQKEARSRIAPYLTGAAAGSSQQE